jgi:hypothetical protein
LTDLESRVPFRPSGPVCPEVAGGIDWIVRGSNDELALIAALPLPHVPAQWVRQRWSGDDRWVAHTKRILSDPTYLALHRWTTLAFPSHPGCWSTLAASLATNAHLVASGEWPVERMRRRLARSVARSERDEARSAGASRRLQARYGVVDKLVPGAWFDRCASPSAPVAAPSVEASVLGWLAAAVGDGWLTPAARQVLSEGLDLAAEFVASSAKRPGLDVLAAVEPSSSISPCHRLTRVLGHLPRPARHAVRCFVLGPTERSGVGGPANSLVVWAASEADPASVPARLVAVWRYHAAMLDPQIAEVATGDRERNWLRSDAARPDLAHPLRVSELLTPNGADRVSTSRQHQLDGRSAAA